MPSAGRQSPSPSRLSEAQQSAPPGWAGRRRSSETSPMFNPSGHTGKAAGSEHMQPSGKEGSEQEDVGGGVEGLKSNPEHPLARAARSKLD